MVTSFRRAKKQTPNAWSGNNGWFYSADNKFAPLQAEDANPRLPCRTSFPVMGRSLDFTSLTVTLDTCWLIIQPPWTSLQSNAASVVTALISSSTACFATCILTSLSPPFLLLFLPVFLLCLFCRCPGLWEPSSGTLSSIPGQESQASSIS